MVLESPPSTRWRSVEISLSLAPDFLRGSVPSATRSMSRASRASSSRDFLIRDAWSSLVLL